MLFTAIAIFISANLLLPKLFKLKEDNVWSRLIGLFTIFLLAFIFCAIPILTSKKEFTPNKYPLDFSTEMEGIGFRDGDKIISANGKKIETVEEIPTEILMNSNSILIERNNQNLTISIPNEKIVEIIQSKEELVTVSNTGKAISKVSESYGFDKVLDVFIDEMKVAIQFLFPSNSYKSLNDFQLENGLQKLRFSLLLVYIINLLPIPGFSIGNFIIAIIEKVRKQKFNPKKLRIISIICVVLTILFLLFYNIKIYKILF